MSLNNDDLLGPLVGREMTGVSFVMDYIVFQFEADFLTALSNPYLEDSGTTLRAGMSGYRDALCDRILHKVTSASDAVEKEIRIGFDDGSLIGIPFGLEEYNLGEAAILQIGPDIKCVWNPK
jgi:hypothetical protein